jgi:AcrR family transcriptional regulator
MSVREAKKEQRRAAIEAAGLDLFVQEGYDLTSVEKIVAASDIARGTFYLYFKDKHALFETLVERLYGPLVEILEEHQLALSEARNTSQQQALYMKMAWAMTEQVVKLQPLALLHFRVAWSAGPAGETVRQWRNRIESLARSILVDANQRGFVRDHDHTIVAMAIVGAAERLAWAWVSSDGELDKARVATELADLFWKGIHGWEPAPTA